MKKIILLLIAVLFSINIFAQNIDIDLLKNINSNRNNTLDIFFTLLSDTVAWIAFGVPCLLLIISLVNKIKMAKATALYIGAATIFAALFSTFLKHSINRIRPFVTYPFIQKLSTGGSPSFPSGHTTDAFVFATALSFAYPKWYIIIPVYLWALAVGYSRMYLGVHYPSDVLGGIIIGAGSATLLYLAKKALAKKKEQKRLSALN